MKASTMLLMKLLIVILVGLLCIILIVNYYEVGSRTFALIVFSYPLFVIVSLWDYVMEFDEDEEDEEL